jgi:hypothetical protein
VAAKNDLFFEQIPNLRRRSKSHGHENVLGLNMQTSYDLRAKLLIFKSEVDGIKLKRQDGCYALA